MTDQDKQELAAIVSESHHRDAAQRPHILGAHPVLIPTGILFAIIGPFCAFLWLVFGRDRDLDQVKKVAAASTEVNEKQATQIEWLRQAMGNPENRWTWSMETIAMDELASRNPTIIKPDVKQIHDMQFRDQPWRPEFPR